MDVIEYELPDDSESDFDVSSGSSGTDVRFQRAVEGARSNFCAI